MNVDIRHPRFRSVVGTDVAFEQFGNGFLFTEGPIWNPAEQHLVFSDIPDSQMWRWRYGEGVTSFRKPSNMANGNTYDRQGRIVTCEHATSRVTRTEADGAIVALASHWDGKELNSPNDIVVSSGGAIYFTDPAYGRLEFYGVARDQELAFQGVFRIDPGDNALTLLVDDFEAPNGLCFTLDESRLFINDTEREHVRVFDVAADGAVSNGSIWAEPVGDGAGRPDGMKIDSEENLYCTGPGGIHVFDPAGTCLGVILVPELVANFTWGDADMRSLFITASTSLYRVRVGVPGLKLF